MKVTATVIADKDAIANGTSIDVCVVADISLAQYMVIPGKTS